MKSFLFAIVLATVSTAASAHEVWVERDGAGPARIYLGEPEAPLPEGGDPEFAKLVAPKLLTPATGEPVRKAGYIEVAVAPGDVRAWDDAVFQPWGEPGKRESVVFYARAGRADTRAALPFEIVPTKSGSDLFRLVRAGKPVAGAEVTIIAPSKATQKVTTDANGGLSVPAREKGRYLLSAAAKDDKPGEDVATIHHITTTTFVR